MNYNELCDTKIFFYTLKKMKEYILNINIEKIAIVISNDGIERWHLNEFKEELDNKYNVTWINFDGTNPTSKDIKNSISLMKIKDIKLIIAIGGGSIIDLAKAISIFYNSNCSSVKEIKNSIRKKSYLDNQKNLDIIAIPTTAGTGSEVTRWATIWDEEENLKYSIETKYITPRTAIIVPELTLTLPSKITLSTGLDAISHAIEAYWSKFTNKQVQEIAITAIEMIVKNLRLSIDNPLSIEYRIKMCEASLIAGIAFSKTSTTACHAISYPLTQLYKIPHGIAVAMTLDKIANINRGHFNNDERLFSIFDKYNGISGWIDYVSNNLVTFELLKQSIKNNDIQLIVKKAFENSRMYNNPVEITEEDVYDIFI